MIGTLMVAITAVAPVLTTSYTFGADSQIAYHLVHPLHQVTGTSHALRGQLTLTGDRLVVPLTLRLPLLTFDSGNANRDANAAATLDVGRFPAATLEIVRFVERTHTRTGAVLDIVGEASGTLTLHGIARPVSVPIRAHVDATGLTVDGDFNVSLTDHQIPRPALLFKPVEDAVHVTVHGVATSPLR